MSHQRKCSDSLIYILASHQLPVVMSKKAYLEIHIRFAVCAFGLSGKLTSKIKDASERSTVIQTLARENCQKTFSLTENKPSLPPFVFWKKL